MPYADKEKQKLYYKTKNKRNCDCCGKYYEGMGKRFCSTACSSLIISRMKGKKHSVETKNKIGFSSKGRHHSKETKEKIRKSHIGIKNSSKTREKIRLSKIGKIPWNYGKIGVQKGVRGEKHYRWKGGKNSENQKIRKSIEYKLWRIAVFERDGYTCVWCYEKGGILNADHIKPFSLFPELRFAIDNGRTLCLECHKKTDTYQNKIHEYKKNYANKTIL